MQIKPHMTSVMTRRQSTINFKLPLSREINTKIQLRFHCLCEDMGTQRRRDYEKEKRGADDTDEAQRKTAHKRKGSPTSDQVSNTQHRNLVVYNISYTEGD